MRLFCLLALLFLFATGFSQKKSSAPLDLLVGKTWKATGTWGDGTPFIQEITFRYGPGNKSIIAESMGYTDAEQTKYGWRNHGIRHVDDQNGIARFWEFDALGGLTEGNMLFDGKNIIYQYQYGDVYITDYWEYVDDDTYKFTVGNFELGTWNEKYLETTFRGVSKPKSSIPDYGSLLEGSWTSVAWNGKLDETWSKSEDGTISQSAKYMVDGEVQYEAQNRIVQVGDELILFTVIKDANPKIFQATFYDAGEIIFENDEYENPSVVKYKFLPNGTFHRTISGIENGIQSSYTFAFKKVRD